jgi:hypothetical protein
MSDLLVDRSAGPLTAERPAARCPFHAGMESHVGPFGDPNGVVVKATSDAMFGPDGLGFAGTPWMILVSWLARTGISEQTGSKPNETIVKSCVLGWGQGAYSSHVFREDGSADLDQLDRLILHLRYLAKEVEGDPTRLTSATVAAFVGAQPAQPYRTVKGPREAGTARERWASRFRGHIQWQSLVALCGHVTTDGTKVVTPKMLKRFFGGEGSFFMDLIDRRRKLLAGELRPGEPTGLLEDVDAGIDRERTDRAYMKTKSALWVVLKILYYMAIGKGKGLRTLSAG